MSPDRLRGLLIEYGKLTPRQRQFFDLAAEGYRYRVIAERMGVTHQTVKTYVWTMRDKMGILEDRDFQSQAAYLRGYIHGVRNTDNHSKAVLAHD